MPLFIVRHQHDPGRCPARDPGIGAMLLNHLSRQNLRRHGITVQAEAVARAEHALYMIVEAVDEGCVREYLALFAAAGSLDVYAAATCAGVVASGGCAALAEPVEDSEAAVDPEEACQQAIDDGLLVHRAHPLNCETPLPQLFGGVVMPNAHFYVRNHFQIPKLAPSSWRLNVGGLVQRPLTLDLGDIAAMPSQTRVVTLECAGNGRSTLAPQVDGEQWNLGAVSTAEWTGVPLSEVLDRAGVRAEGKFLAFAGADSGKPEEADRAIRFERGLSLDEARESDALLAYVMNGEPLPPQHGYPLRLILPAWYAVASVKWLTDIAVVDQPLQAHYQTGKYYYEWQREGRTVREPVSLKRVRSLIIEPAALAGVSRGGVTIRGVAWSGAAPVAKVEVTVGGGAWREARLIGERNLHSWQWWELITTIDHAGPCVIAARATDLAGRTQPEAPEWNRLGYGNNAVQKICITVI